MRHRKGLTAALAVMLTALAAGAQGTASDAIDALLTAYRANGLFNGAALVAAGDEVVIRKGYGWANFEWHAPVTPDTRFRIGSLTKQFTAALVLKLVEDGTLSLDDTVSARLPWYRRDTGTRVTLHQLLNHTSGIPNYTDQPGYFEEHGRDPLPVKTLVSDFCSGDLEFEPGSTFRYSNSGYVILGAIIEEVTGKPFEDVLHDRILAPAGMAATGYDHAGFIIERRAAGYERTFAGIRNAPYLDMSLPHAAGALYSTVEDLFAWDHALYGTSLLSEDSKRRMFTPGLGDYGYGWRIQSRPVGPQEAALTVISHQGVINGFHAIITRIPDDRILVVLLNNTGTTELPRMSDGILDILYGRAPAPARPPIAALLWDIVHEDGAATAVAEYRRLKAERPDDYDFGEEWLLKLGHELLETAQAGAAVEIFKLNAEEHPDSFNAHDSLAEAYAAEGETELAIKSYARSLVLNPDNVNAVHRLQELANR